MKFGFSSINAGPATEISYQPSSGLHYDSFAILNKHKVPLAKLYYKTDEDKAFIEEITQWKADYLKENHCPLRRLAGYSECYKNKAIENAEPKDILNYIKNFIKPNPTGGKRKSLRPHKKSKKRKQTKHMKKGKNGKKSKTKR